MQTGHLNFTKGVYIGLVLTEPVQNETLLASDMGRKLTSSGSSSAHVDSWSSAVQCYSICLDINWDNFINEADFLMVVSRLGVAATGNQACFEGVF